MQPAEHALTEFAPAQHQFLQQILHAWQNQQLEKVIFSQYSGEEARLEKIILRPILLKNQAYLQATWRYQNQDITKNYDESQSQTQLSLFLQQFKQANGFFATAEWQLKWKKQQWQLQQHQRKQTAPIAPPSQHNREKKRYIDPQAQFLQHLGISDHQHRIMPTMQGKWKQINKFIEIFAQTLGQMSLPRERDVHIVDFGSGKGYLTFAMYAYLLQNGSRPCVTGVELRDELVQFCQRTAEQVGFEKLHFYQGDVRSYQPQHTDVMVALHACDIATDFAIHTGIRLNASVIMTAPCCHKELRPQLKSPKVLQPMLQFGVHAGQQAEMLTDSLRAMLLQAYGYETKILEFVGVEHTSKNKMILAVKSATAQKIPNTHILQQVEELKRFYGIEKQTLQGLLTTL